MKHRRKPRPGEYSNGLSAQDKPNAVWGADFRGWFRLASGGQKCYPITISDGYSRLLLRCKALRHADELACRKVFDEAFVEFGLPDTIRTDNGTPFSAVCGVSALSVWWVKLGIRPERITRGRPTENGRHERIHRTLQGHVINAGRVRRTSSASSTASEPSTTSSGPTRPSRCERPARPSRRLRGATQRSSARRSMATAGRCTEFAATARSSSRAVFCNCPRCSLANLLDFGFRMTAPTRSPTARWSSGR